jgi:hypothetical protein
MERRTPDTAVADAIDRVLAAESEAAGVIAAAQQEAEATIEAARERRRLILERARLRTSRLHVRAQARLERALEELDGHSLLPATDLATLRELARKALQNLAARLTSDDHGSH